MSALLTSRNPDLKRLKEEGFEVEVRSGYLVIHHVPYVAPGKVVKYGTLVTPLTLQGDKTARPSDHVMQFAGEFPCKRDGSEFTEMGARGQHTKLVEGLEVDHSFSRKPPGGYADYYEKVTNYVNILAAEARMIDPTATAKTFKEIVSSDEQSVFHYEDTASSRAQITATMNKLRLAKVAIIGVGGTGSYVLDLVAKTPVQEIHLFDGDTVLTHNAFRAPGAPSLEELREGPLKVHYLRDIYSKMRKGIEVHPVRLDESNVSMLDGMDFVFLCIDEGKPKVPIVAKLEAANIPFVDVGMGVEVIDDGLTGKVRTTLSTPKKRDHFRSRATVGEGNVEDDYSLNIQIADLNALNAALAVIYWKKYFGFYLDLPGKHSTYFDIFTHSVTLWD